MNTFNLTKRPTICLPETAEEMLNLLTYNALEQAGIEKDKAEYWEQKYNGAMQLIRFLGKKAYVNITSSGNVYIRLESIFNNYDGEMFDIAVNLMDLGAKLIEAEADFKKEENETNN